jgi:hypothetical protein
MEKDAVVAQIVKVLSPYLGPTMAEASARTHCEKLGIAGKEMTTEQTEALIGKLGTGLAVFVGREKSRAVVLEIRQAVQPRNQVA